MPPLLGVVPAWLRSIVQDRSALCFLGRVRSRTAPPINHPYYSQTVQKNLFDNGPTVNGFGILECFFREAAVEPAISVENDQLTDSVNARNEQNAMFAKSAYKSRTNYS
jgi:hypothetical protein